MMDDEHVITVRLHPLPPDPDGTDPNAIRPAAAPQQAQPLPAITVSPGDIEAPADPMPAPAPSGGIGTPLPPDIPPDANPTGQPSPSASSALADSMPALQFGDAVIPPVAPTRTVWPPFTLTPVDYDPFPERTAAPNGAGGAPVPTMTGGSGVPNPASPPNLDIQPQPVTGFNSFTPVAPSPASAGSGQWPPFTLTPVDYDPFADRAAAPSAGATPSTVTPGSSGLSAAQPAPGSWTGTPATSAVTGPRPRMSFSSQRPVSGFGPGGAAMAPVVGNSGSDGASSAAVGDPRRPTPTGLAGHSSAMAVAIGLAHTADRTAASATQTLARLPSILPRLIPSLVDPLGQTALKALRTFAGRLALPITIFNTAFVPSPNPGTVAEGPVPGRPGTRYRLDHDTGLLRIASDSDPDPRHDRIGQLGPHGIYHDVTTGLPVARMVGDAVVINLDRTAADNEKTDDQPKLCPEPVLDQPGGRRKFDVMYEQYVRAYVNPHRAPTPAGWTVALLAPSGKLVHFDDCRDSDGTMIEAKGHYARFMKASIAEKILTAEWSKQATSQVKASNARGLEWYFHEQAAADLAKRIFAKDPGLSKIMVKVLIHRTGVPNPNPRIP